MTTAKHPQQPGARRRGTSKPPSGRKVELHELWGRAYLMLPPEIHDLMGKARLEQARGEMEQQVYLMELKVGRRLLRLHLPVSVMVWPPEKDGPPNRKDGP